MNKNTQQNKITENNIKKQTNTNIKQTQKNTKLTQIAQ